MNKPFPFLRAIAPALLVSAGLSVTTALPALAAEPAMHDPRGAAKADAPGYTRIIPPAGVIAVTEPTGTGQSFQVAQSADAAFRVNQLEEQVRKLNGQVEELTFQLLQMQEQIRRMQEDNEFRFQELEQKQGAATGAGDDSDVADAETGSRNGGNDSLEKPEPSEPAGGESLAANGSGGNRTIDGVEIFDPENPDAGDSVDTGRDGDDILPLGTLIFDENGNVVDSAVGRPIELGRPQGQSGQETSAPVASEDELYDLGYSYIQSGQYDLAEETFREYSERYPDADRISEARFWLGESLFARSEFKEAAQIYIDAHKQWPDGRLAPQTLLKLGLSLAGLNQRELACATYAEVDKKYPSASNVLKQKVVAEQRAAKCITN